MKMFVYVLCWAIPIGMYKVSAIILANLFADLMIPYDYSKVTIVETVVGIHNTIYIFWIMLMIMWSFKFLNDWRKKEFKI